MAYPATPPGGLSLPHSYVPPTLRSIFAENGDECVPHPLARKIHSGGHRFTEKAKREIKAHGLENRWDLFWIEAPDNDTPLHKAARTGQRVALRTLIQDARPEELYARDGNGYIPLHWVTKADDAQAMLNRMPIDELSVEANHGWTPLNQAIAARLPEVALTLIPGMRPDQLTVPTAGWNKGFTPLLGAVSDDQYEVAMALIPRLPLEALYIQDKDGDTPLWHACQGFENDQKIAVVKALLDRIPKEKTSIPSKNGWTPLHVAAYYGFTETVKLLLSELPHEALLLQNSRGETALELAQKENHLETAQVIALAMEKPPA